MPLELTTALDMGAIDADYTHVKILNFLLHSEGEFIEMVVAHGTVDGGGAFTVGKRVAGVTPSHFRIEGADYATIVSAVTSDTGVPIYNEVARELYQWLIDEGHYIGTIV